MNANNSSRNSNGGWTLSDSHRSEVPGARAAAGKILSQRYACGRPQVVSVLIHNHRDEYNEILADIVRKSVNTDLEV